MSTARAPLRPLDEALAELLSRARPLADTEQVATFDADGRVLAQEVVSLLHVPPQDNSSMDGYALRCADVAPAGVVLPVSQRIAAGSSGAALLPGTAARIFTGAPVPSGANTIVMQEDCEPADDGRAVRVNIVPTPGQWIRRAGEDVTRDAVVLHQGERLSPASLGLAASIGMAQLTVRRKPRVALFSTGDELKAKDVVEIDVRGKSSVADYLVIASGISGVIVFDFGAFKLGTLIRFIPVAVVIGFTNGIAVLIALSQIKDFLGLQVVNMPADFFGILGTLQHALHTTNLQAAGIAAGSLAIIIFWQFWLPRLGHDSPRAKRFSVVPGSVIALILATLAVSSLDLQVDTIGSRCRSARFLF